MRNGRFFLGDLGSTNGTFVGEFPSSASRQVVKGNEEEVSDGQLILFGDVECTLSAPDGGTFTKTADPGSARSSEASSASARSSASNREADALADASMDKLLASRGLLGGGRGAPVQVDYDEIRKIIREEVSAVAGATAMLNMSALSAALPPAHASTHPGANDDSKPSSAGGPRRATAADHAGEKALSPGSKSSTEFKASEASPRFASAAHKRDARTAATEGPWDRVENDKLHPLGAGYGTGTVLGQPKQMTYDIEEELRLAEDLARVEAHVGEHVNEMRNVLGVEERTGLAEGVPSRRKGFLARQEQRRLKMLEIGKKRYRKQAPYNELGEFLLPTGALHRVLANLPAIPYLCILAPACKQVSSRSLLPPYYVSFTFSLPYDTWRNKNSYETRPIAHRRGPRTTAITARACGGG